MLTVYIICAVVGGVVLIVQLALSVSGILGDTDDVDLVDSDGHVDFQAHDADHTGEDSSSFFKLLSLRALIAALTFFGLGGGLADAAGSPDLLSFGFGVMLGGIAMVVVAWLFSLLHKLHEEGNVQIQYALGSQAVVYLKIPGHKQGMGKVTVTVQDCSMEYNALTTEDEIPSGKTVTIVDIIDATTVEVLEPK